MTTLIFDWSDWDGPATGHVIVTRRTWRRAPESLHVPWQVVLPVDGRATLDVAHVAGEAVSISWTPKGAASREDHVLVPAGGEHLAHLLDLVDPSTLEPLPEDLPSAVDLVARAEALVSRIESGEFTGAAGTDGRGVASITADGTQATVTYTDGTASTLTLPRGPAGEPGRDGVDGAPGVDGRDGQDGRTPDLSWQGTALAVDGVPGPDLRGPAGKDGRSGVDGAAGRDGAPGPAPAIKIGTVTSGTTPSATITGTSPDLTLGLVLPKGDRGDKGETGAPGVVSSASSYVLVGPGRPDTPSTTGGVITGNEPVGAEYRSTDGANVGAWTWRKRPTGWAVTDGDTGWRKVSRPVLSDGFQFYRRINDVVHVAWGGGQWGAVKVATNYNAGATVRLLENRTTAESTPAGFGFTRAVVAPSTDDGKTINGVYYAADTPSADQGLVQIRSLTSPITTATYLRPPQTSAATHEAWPTTLPGSPA